MTIRSSDGNPMKFLITLTIGAVTFVSGPSGFVSACQAAGQAGDEHGDEHGDHEESSNSVGPDKAVTAANKKEGIRLSEGAVKTLGLSYSPIAGDKTFRVPLKAVVFFQNETGIYRFKDGWYKLIEVDVVSKSAAEATVKSSELKAGDQVVITGVPLLRAAELDATGGSEEGHGH